jgi:hypothetical protein
MGVAALSCPKAVHLHMLRGDIAKLTPAQIAHLYRGESAAAVLAEIKRQDPEVWAAAILAGTMQPPKGKEPGA